ncbi:MAG: CBS domain-containing protein [Acidobacteriota bacterium]|nr:CBS domain-containing protein [Acidobacteriota bacterium]
MSTQPLIKSVMTPFPYSITLDAEASEARGMMKQHDIRHLPVKDVDGQTVGLVTDRDLKLLLGPYLSQAHNDRALVRHACVFDPYTVDLDTPLQKVVEHMAKQRIGSALVTKEGRLAGIFTAVDACRLFADLLATDFPSGDDAA